MHFHNVSGKSAHAECRDIEYADVGRSCEDTQFVVLARITLPDFQTEILTNKFYVVFYTRMLCFVRYTIAISSARI